MWYGSYMKPGREYIPEVGSVSETRLLSPEQEHSKNLADGVERYTEFIDSFRPTVHRDGFGTDITYRKRVAEQLGASSEERLRSFPDGTKQLKKNTQVFFDSNAIVRSKILQENRDAGRVPDEDFFSSLYNTVQFQQEMSRLILQHRFVPTIDTSMQKFWGVFEKASSPIISDPNFAREQQHGIEHAVTASHLLETRGWRIHKPRVKSDIQEGIDGFATGTTLEGKEIILALQFKSTPATAPPLVDVKVLYPFPNQADIEEDAWNLVESVKKYRLKNPNLPLFPVIMRIPPAEKTPHIRRGTGLLASLGAADALLDETGKKALEYAETLVDVKIEKQKPKKKVIYVPQGK
ncbi:MAG: hypothetical protein A3J55_03955 [Candidatus Ryanbacteria bacterium RIFCSPHIGHO2_02_FULL_45_17b]|nr:MAG: hypothetical protein A3J55_03955 [Candidatus Ryanbacteria bacterium RIFCSPHIGHO2_02_FULL_45_17b]